MSTDKELVLRKDTETVIEKSYQAIIEGLTGILSSERKELILSCGFILQKLRGGKFLDVLNKEWKQYREKGRIPEDYVGTEQNEECLQEILDYLEKDDILNEVTFDALKKIFLMASTEKISKRESHLPQQYMKICRKLSQGALIVLFATYHEGYGKKVPGKPWRERMFERTGFDNQIIEIFEEELYKYKLIDGSGIPNDKQEMYRLTKFGYDLCSYIENYEE